MNDAESKPSYEILAIDQSDKGADELLASLREATEIAFTIQRTGSLQEGLGRLELDKPDAILLDIKVEDARRLDAFERVQAAAPDVPVLILAQNDDAELAMQAVQKGAHDYLVKDRINPQALIRSLRYSIERERAFRRRFETVRNQAPTLEDELVDKPAAPADEAAGEAGDEAADGTEGEEGSAPKLPKWLNILIVDDSKLIRAVIARHIKTHHWGVEEAANGHEALGMLRRARNTNKPVDVVILDLMMPQMDGFEFLERLRENEQHAKLAVVVLTSKSDRQSVLRCGKLGVRNYLIKPFNSESVFHAVEKAYLRARQKDEEE